MSKIAGLFSLISNSPNRLPDSALWTHQNGYLSGVRIAHCVGLELQHHRPLAIGKRNPNTV